MIKGRLVKLCAIEEKDLNQILEWRNNAKFRLNFREYKELSYYQEYEWFKEINSKKCNDEYNFSLRLVDSDEIIGVVGLNYINWINRNCQLSLYIGKDDIYIDDFGWAEEALKMIEKYAFETLNLHKIFTEIFEFDVKKKSLLENNHFKQEAELKDHIFKSGKYYDSFILSKVKR